MLPSDHSDLDLHARTTVACIPTYCVDRKIYGAFIPALTTGSTTFAKGNSWGEKTGVMRGSWPCLPFPFFPLCKQTQRDQQEQLLQRIIALILDALFQLPVVHYH